MAISQNCFIYSKEKGKSVTDPDSYRVLSMLDNIYKMYAKLIALRMATPLRYIQNPQQFGFTENKGCLEASRSVIDAIRAANLEGLQMIVLSTDFYKAFDSIALDHVENCLNFYEFPDRFMTAFMRLIRGSTMQTSYRVHLAHDIVAQPARFGGLSVPDPQIQIKSLRFIWIKKFFTQKELSHSIKYLIVGL